MLRKSLVTALVPATLGALLGYGVAVSGDKPASQPLPALQAGEARGPQAQPGKDQTSASPARAPQSPDEKAIRQLAADYVKAFRKGDVDAVLTFWDVDAEFIDEDGKITKGREAVGALHEFRALTLFAQKAYQEAAAAIYAVLSAGPGWTWETLAPMYGNTETYIQQLRALEAYTRANPKSSAARFLLAYQYLVLGHMSEALKQLQEVVKLSTDDQLAKQLIQAFTNPETPKPEATG
jgi:tetratricopeptide (TPR) repeat protein